MRAVRILLECILAMVVITVIFVSSTNNVVAGRPRRIHYKQLSENMCEWGVDVDL